MGIALSSSRSIVVLLSICFTLVFLHDCRAINSYESGEILHVLAVSGMNLRDAPKGNVLKKIPYGARIKTLQAKSTTNSETIEGIEGNWVKVDFSGATGFLFDGFLSTLPAPELNGRNLLAYAERSFGRVSSQLPISYIENTEGASVLSTQLFLTGRDTFVYYADQYYEGLTEFLSIPNISIEEGYLLIRAAFGDWYAETIRGLNDGSYSAKDYQMEPLTKFVLNGTVLRHSATQEDVEVPAFYHCLLGSGCSYEITIRMFENRVFISAGGGC